MILLGFDIGSSSVKATLVHADTGKTLASAFYPKEEMPMDAPRAGWAEQHPDLWWKYLKLSTQKVLQTARLDPAEIRAIGISYQMHGLVAVNAQGQVVRPSIIWCDSRAVDIGDRAFQSLGPDRCLEHLLNSPGNFTASKLRWVKENEPEIAAQVAKIMLPGDYLTYRMTGRMNTTISGLSEGILWDFKENRLASFLLDHYGFDEDIIPEVMPVFAIHGELKASIAEELGLKPGIPLAYRAGDQPNNAFSLGVLDPGELAATAGTSGVVYGVSDEVKYDPGSRVNTFAHVNHTREQYRLGVLLCINGTGILYRWLRRQLGNNELSYPEMNELSSRAPAGSDGLLFYPFGNGAERMLGNRDPGASMKNLNFNIHQDRHLIRSGLEGIAFSFKYGLEIMKDLEIDYRVIRAGQANLFLSPVFRQVLASLTGATIKLFETDGSRGAALGAGIGAGIYGSYDEAFAQLGVQQLIEPDPKHEKVYRDTYERWKEKLEI